MPTTGLSQVGLAHRAEDTLVWIFAPGGGRDGLGMVDATLLSQLDHFMVNFGLIASIFPLRMVDRLR